MLNNQDFTLNRANFIGGSDMAAILGLSKYRTPVDVWLEKTGQASKQPSTLPMRFGQYTEEFIAQEYARLTNQTPAIYEEPFIDSKHAFLAGHIDRFVLSNHESLFDSQQKLNTTKLLECKTANPFMQQEWGEAGTDAVPMPYLVQCLWYLMLTGCLSADIAVLFGNSDFRIYTISKNLDIEYMLREKACHFWNTYVLTKQAPPVQNEEDCRILFARSIPNKVMHADAGTLELVGELKNVHCELEKYSQRESDLKQAIMQTMQDAEELRFEEQVLATWKTPKPTKRLDTKRLTQAYPEIAKEFEVVSPNTRRFVFKGLNVQ